jgi:uncharacterized membrane protein YjfL (UPF0719 family)
MLIVISLGGAFYVWYSQSGNDTTPGGAAGLGYAIVGTLCFILAAVLYSVRRRLRKQAIGRLNAALNWHVFFAIIGLVLLFMHSFGHFDPISGTYALYGMIALTLSGFVGRVLDHLMPRLIAHEVNKVLTSQGEDGIETVSQKLQAIVAHNAQEIHGFGVGTSRRTPVSVTPEANSLPFPVPGQSLGPSWDLAYISLELTQQELDHNAPHYRFIPDKKSALNRPEALVPGAEEQLSKLRDMHLAMQREQFYRYVIRYWRVLHVVLAFVTIGLVIWHIIFATQLLLPRLFH